MVMEMHSNKLLEILYYVVWMDSSLKEGVDFIQDSVQFQVRRHVPLEYKYVMCRMYKCVCSVQRHSHQGCLSSSNTRARGVALRHDNHRLACWQSGGVDRRSGCCDCGGLLVGNVSGRVACCNGVLNLSRGYDRRLLTGNVSCRMSSATFRITFVDLNISLWGSSADGNGT
eukprot:scpid81941/ scgid1090/ 